MDILLMGPPAGGKGTQARYLIERGYYHLCTGEMFRDHIRRRTKLGQKIALDMAEGRFMSDLLTNAIVEEEISHAGRKPILFDGFPRTQVQAHWLDALMAQLGRSIKAVVNIEPTRDVLIERMTKRSGEQGRPEDNAEAFELRLADYHLKTEPLLKHYGALVHRIDGLGTPEETSQSIAALLS